MPTFVVGPGIARAMNDDNTRPATDEVFVHGNSERAQWSIAFGDNGTEYRWLPATGRVHRYRPGAVATGLAGKLQRVVEAGLAEGWKPYSGPIVGQPDSYRWGTPGYDCSSFVASMYRKVLNIQLVGFTDTIASQTDLIDKKDALPGDIILYRYQDSSQVGVVYPHTGLWLGNGMMLDCQFPKGLGTHGILAKPYVIHRARGI
jgi:cell wall-associated NlpC family hydrolase